MFPFHVRRDSRRRFQQPAKMTVARFSTLAVTKIIRIFLTIFTFFLDRNAITLAQEKHPDIYHRKLSRLYIVRVV